jgi:ATP-binding cassette subfamily B protein
MENKHKYKLKELFKHYKMLIGIIAKEALWMVVGTFAAAILSGLATTAVVFAGRHIFDDGLKVAAGTLTFGQYIPYIVLFLLASVIPDLVVNAYVYGHVQERSLLILRTTYRGKMLQKLKRLKYAHFENQDSIKIMDMAFDHAENSARHMFPMYVMWEISSLIASIGLLWQFAQITPWLLLTLLAPFALDLWISTKRSFSVYDEMQKYWDKERRYRRLGGYLRSRDYAKEQKLFGSSDFLVDTYQKRLNERNREYEKYYYFKHLKMRITSSWVTGLAILGNAVFMLLLFIGGKASVGAFIALTLCLFGGLYDSLGGATIFFRASGFHIQFLDFYNKFFALSEDPESECAGLPNDFEIEFKNVRFAYPNTDREI